MFIFQIPRKPLFHQSLLPVCKMNKIVGVLGKNTFFFFKFKLHDLVINLLKLSVKEARTNVSLFQTQNCYKCIHTKEAGDIFGLSVQHSIHDCMSLMM